MCVPLGMQIFVKGGIQEGPSKNHAKEKKKGTKTFCPLLIPIAESKERNRGKPET